MFEHFHAGHHVEARGRFTAASASALIFAVLSPGRVPASSAWSCATLERLGGEIDAQHFGPLRAMASARMPPPQPISATFWPASGTRPLNPLQP
jgi:hypothetical protein